jgi:hypothetical protein
MRIYCKPEHLHSFVQGVVDATGTTEGVDVLPMYGRMDCIDHYCIRIHNYKLHAVMEKVIRAIHKVIDSWEAGEAIETFNAQNKHLATTEGWENIHEWVESMIQ